jgi:hypothetical protein
MSDDLQEAVKAILLRFRPRLGIEITMEPLSSLPRKQALDYKYNAH